MAAEFCVQSPGSSFCFRPCQLHVATKSLRDCVAQYTGSLSHLMQWFRFLDGGPGCQVGQCVTPQSNGHSSLEVLACAKNKIFASGPIQRNPIYLKVQQEEIQNYSPRILGSGCDCFVTFFMKVHSINTSLIMQFKICL